MRNIRVLVYFAATKGLFNLKADELFELEKRPVLILNSARKTSPNLTPVSNSIQYRY